MFAKNTLASAVAAAIGVSAVGVAQADTVFFPYAALSPTVTTVVSVINTSDANWTQDGQPGGANLHYRFYYKDVSAGEGLLNPCEEYNEYLPTSRNDIQTIDLGGQFGSDTAGVLFNDPSINNDWQSSGRDYAFGRNIWPARGYLTVDNNDPADVNVTLAGEAFAFEFGNGAAWGYQAHSSVSNDFRGAASKSPSNIALMPFDEITTAFFVTPVSIDQHPDAQNNYRARIELVSSTNPAEQRGDLYDRDENLISGTLPQDVVCVGRVNATDLMSDATAARLVNGGWGRVWNYRMVFNTNTQQWERAGFVNGSGQLLDNNYAPVAGATYNAMGSSDSDNLASARNLSNALNLSRNDATPGAVIIKLEYNLGGTFNDEAVGGTYNNGIMFSPDKNNPF